MNSINDYLFDVPGFSSSPGLGGETENFLPPNLIAFIRAAFPLDAFPLYLLPIFF
jgi:hypothetical protein